jgi:hypothetical protein
MLKKLNGAPDEGFIVLLRCYMLTILSFLERESVNLVSENGHLAYRRSQKGRKIVR